MTIKRLLLIILLAWGASDVGRCATASSWINTDNLTQLFNIDATNVINKGSIIISTGSSGYDGFSNVRYYTNQGVMLNSNGVFRFDNAPVGAGSRKPSVSFHNAIASGNPSTNASIHASLLVDISATNVVNRGLLSSDSSGQVFINGKSVDLSRGTIRVGSGTGGGSGVRVFDRYWGFDTNVFEFADSLIVTNPPPVPDFPLFYLVTNFLNGSGQTYSLGFRTLQFDGLTQDGMTNGITWTNFSVGSAVGGNQTIQVIYVQNPNPDISVSINSYSASATRLGTIVVDFSSPANDGSGTTNHLYVTDAYGNDPTNFNFAVSFPTGSSQVRTYRPVNFLVTPNQPFVQLFGVPATQSLAVAELAAITESVGIVSDATAFAYGARASAGSAFTVTESDLRVSPGRVELSADSILNLALARVDSSSYLKLQSTNHVVSPTANASISAPYLDFNLGTTNGTFDTTGLFVSSVPRIVGNCDLYSVVWTNTIIDTNGLGTTNNIKFQVLYVDSDLTASASTAVLDGRIRSTNLTVGNTLRMRQTLDLNVDNLTLTTNGIIDIAGSTIKWISSATHIKNLTNSGIIVASNAVEFVSGGVSGPAVPYQSFVNDGQITAASVSVDSGRITSTGGKALARTGPISLNAVSNLLLLDGSSLVASNADVWLSGTSLVASNQTISAGREISLSFTDSVASGGSNIWTCNAGLNLLVKPATGDLSSVGVTITAQPYANIYNLWAGEDRGPSSAGFTDNAALGSLTLNGGLNSLFTFWGPGPSSNALYLDVLILKNSATNRDAGGNLTALSVEPGMKIYFGQAFTDDGTGTLTDITSALDGKNGGGLTLVTHSGPLSLPRPAASYSPAIRVTVEKAPVARSLVSWDTLPQATNYLYCVGHPYDGTWQLITNFVSGPSGGTVTVSDPGLSSSRFYKVRVDAPAQ